NHREEEDQKGNNSPDIETLPLFPIHSGSHHDFFAVKASDLSSDHSVGGYYTMEIGTAQMVGPHLSSLSTHMDIKIDFVCVIYVN
nr:protein WUSCHEL-like [Tanacetum cinerariifolium]